MAAGRIPQPRQLKILKGNPGKRPLRDEPEPEQKVPECPEELTADAKKEWERITVLLSSCGLVTEIDRAALAAYCQVYSRWLEAEREIEELGLVVKTPNGYPILSPYLSVANKALHQMQSFLIEFGMSPAARSRISAAPPKGDESPKARKAKRMFGK
jgi:P27 family predicted phage terminase small subunit